MIEFVLACFGAAVLLRALGVGALLVYRWVRPVITAEPVSKDPYSNFAVEHYPESGWFFPTYKGQYMDQQYGTGIYMLEEDMLFADHASSEAGAWHMIDLFREQQLKENVRVIRRPA